MNWLFDQRARNSSPAKKKDFKTHKMYKDGKSETAGTFQEHLSLKKKGYGHSPAKLTDEQYNKKNTKMRKDHKKPLSNQQTSGTGSARIAFAARFGGQGHSMTEKDGSPSGYAHALKRWGFSSAGEAKSFANKHKKNA
jgi:hypothetical protein